jgi:hypothetical protein
LRLAVKTDLGTRIVRGRSIVPAAVSERDVAGDLLDAGPAPRDLLADKGFSGPRAGAGAPCGLADFAVVQSCLSTAAKWGISKIDALRSLFSGNPMDAARHRARPDRITSRFNPCRSKSLTLAE